MGLTKTVRLRWCLGRSTGVEKSNLEEEESRWKLRNRLAREAWSWRLKLW